jgi:OOP family OmpA-OmpF porin
MGLAVILVSAMAGCSHQKTFPLSAFRPLESDQSFYSKKLDTFVVVLDTGSSMERTYRKRLEAGRAQEIISRLNRTIPLLDYQAALLAFSAGSCLNCEDATVLYGPGPYQRDAFAVGLDRYNASGDEVRSSRLGGSAEASRLILQGHPGRVGLIVAGDSENIFHGRAFKAVQKLKGVLGDRLCVYPIQVDKACDGREVMDQLAKVGGCGFTVNADEIASPDAMAAYVKKVFLTSTSVPAAAAPVYTGHDADGDGVPDSVDKCPDTPRGLTVDTDGCWTLRHVYFDTDQFAIKDPSNLSAAAAALAADPTLTLEVHGHTDNTASTDYNQRLSEARANAVRDYFIHRGIQPNRIQAKGFGETKPAAANETEAGRALNRRIELHPRTP